MPFTITVTHSGAIHHHCYTLKYHSTSLSHTLVPFNITVTDSSAILHHCYTLRCHSPSLSHTQLPFNITVTHSSAIPRGVLSSKRLLGMCRWMRSLFHNLTDYNGVTFLACFSRVTRMGSQIFGIFGIRKFW